MTKQALRKGSFVLSIDTELAWGSVHNRSVQSRLGHYQRTREAITGLLELQERYQIRATWAVVGHLFLDHCQATGGVKHPEITRPDYSWFEGDWFDADPCDSADSNPYWYGPDIVEQILNCKVTQELGCHGFSHLIVGDSGCSRECFDSELRACTAQAKEWDVELKSFIFPRNSVGHLDVLAENGFSSFRGISPDWYNKLSGSYRKLARVADAVLPSVPPVVLPRKEGPLWDIPASYFYPHRDGWNRSIPVGLSVRKAKLALAQAAEKQAVFHLWFHPFNLASDPGPLLHGLESIFERVSELRSLGKLENPSMSDLAWSLEQGKQEVSQH